MKEHYNPKKNLRMERNKFHEVKQAPNESVAQFITRLKNLAINCEFDNFDDRLTDRITCGIRDEAIKILLFSEDKLNLTKATALAINREAAVKNAAGTSKQASATDEVNSLQAARKNRCQHSKGKFARSESPKPKTNA